MDTREENALVVHYGSQMYKFNQCEDGLYFFDTNHKSTNPPVNCYSVNLLQSVNDNKKYYTAREVQGAEAAQKLQQTLGWPSTPALKNIICQSLVNNCTVTVDDVNRDVTSTALQNLYSKEK